MVVHKTLVSAAEFEQFIALPENRERLFELIAGEIVEVSPCNPYSSKISMRFGRHIGNFVDEHDLGHVTGEAGGYMVSGEKYVPDVAFISKTRQPELAREGYNPNAPDLAVEVVSPTDSERRLMVKVANYLSAGTVVWVVYPDEQEVQVYIKGQPVKILKSDDMLDGGSVLPGFQLSLRVIFEN